jgi:hypothetical protein
VEEERKGKQRMSQQYSITQQDGRFVYKDETGQLSVTLYDDGIAIHGARDPFANETWDVLFGSDVASAIFRLFQDPEVQKRFITPE